jgi:hypothetical protein
MVVPRIDRRGCLSSSTAGMWSGGTSYEENEACTGYGVVSFTEDPRQIVLTVKDDAGQVRLQQTFSLDEAIVR